MSRAGVSSNPRAQPANNTAVEFETVNFSGVRSPGTHKIPPSVNRPSLTVDPYLVPSDLDKECCGIFTAIFENPGREPHIEALCQKTRLPQPTDRKRQVSDQLQSLSCSHEGQLTNPPARITVVYWMQPRNPQ